MIERQYTKGLRPEMVWSYGKVLLNPYSDNDGVGYITDGFDLLPTGKWSWEMWLKVASIVEAGRDQPLISRSWASQIHRIGIYNAASGGNFCFKVILGDATFIEQCTVQTTEYPDCGAWHLYTVQQVQNESNQWGVAIYRDGIQMSYATRTWTTEPLGVAGGGGLFCRYSGYMAGYKGAVGEMRLTLRNLTGAEMTENFRYGFPVRDEADVQFHAGLYYPWTRLSKGGTLTTLTQGSGATVYDTREAFKAKG